MAARKKLETSTTTTGPEVVAVNVPAPLDTEFSKRIGISSATIRQISEKKRGERATTEDGKKFNKLLDLISGRIKDGRTFNLRSYRVWAAIDEAFRSPFNQIAPTLVGKILSKNLKADEILKELAAWGLSADTLFTEQEIEVNGVKTKAQVLNEQTFWKVVVPLVPAVVAARTAKLFLDRNVYPFLKYEPFISTEENQAICEVITNVVERMTHQYGYPAMLRKAITASLKYSMVLEFPMESWHYEQDADEKGEVYTKREGLRGMLPHPSRTYWDQLYPVNSFNTDTGCEYGGHWRVMRFGDIENNDIFWNREVIPYGTNWWSSGVSGQYFKELYPCVGKCPYLNSDGTPSPAEQTAIYSSNDPDKAVFITEHFQKLIPSQWGLGKWNHPVWFRFVVASDDVIIFAEPLPYCPVNYLGADADEGVVDNPSMALLALPWQDHLGNVMSQILLSARQNLKKIIYYDVEQVDEEVIERTKSNSKDASGIDFVPFSSKKSKMANVDPGRMFVPIQFPQQNTVELTNVISTVISIMERLLGMSSSEMGAAGVHVQSAEEIRILNSNTGTRAQFTATYIDDYLDAKKRQLYIAVREFGDDKFLAQITNVSDETKKKLTELGFKFEGEPDRNGKVSVSGSKKALSKFVALESFVSSRDGQNRINQPQVATVLMQTIGQIAANPQLSQLVGPKQILDALNRATILAGAPKDFKFSSSEGPDQNLQALQQQLAQMAEQIQQASVEQAVEASKPIAEAVQQQGQQMQAQSDAITKTAEQVQSVGEQLQSLLQVVEKLQSIVGAAQSIQQPLPIEGGMPTG